MIEVISSQKLDSTVSYVQIDEYVPISFRSYQGTIGARYIRIGDLQSSFLELILSSDETVVRGFTLTLFNAVHKPKVLNEVIVVNGLPLVKLPANAKFEGSPYAPWLDIATTLSVGLGQGFAEVLISGTKYADTLLCHGRIGFMLNAGFLIGIRVFDLTSAEVNTLATFVDETKTHGTKT